VNGDPSGPNDTSSTSVVPEGEQPERAASAEETPGRLVPRQRGDGGTPGAADAAAAGSARASSRPAAWGRRRPAVLDPDALRAYWLSPVGLVVLAATGLSLGLRLFILSRPLFLTGVTEYDDGVYLGGAIRLISGATPYHDYAFVQPPGILLLMAPVAVIAKVSTATHAMAAARLLTVLASAACVPLVGHLVRYRGVLVTLVSCGILAVYPDDITTAHTLILEPWMNLLLLIGVCAAFRRGRLTSPQRLFWAGLAIGFAGAVKYWAVLPALALLAVCLVTAGSASASAGSAGRRRTWTYGLGVAAGFAVPVLPFAAAGPGLFVRSTLLDQASRAGSAVPASLRLAHITGLIDILNAKGQINLRLGTHSLFASGGAAGTPTASAGWASFIVAGAAAAVLALGYLWRPRRSSPLEWFALAACLSAVTALLAYSAFFYHYADFVAPWLAISFGCAAGTLGRAFSDRPGMRRSLVAAATALVLGLAVFQARELSGLHTTSIYPDQAAIPAGACVVTDEVSLTLAANRFSTQAGCPDVLDSLAATLVEDNGISVQGGAKASARAVSAWTWIFGHAQYVWLSSDSSRRIPWTHGLERWFASHFKRVPVHRGLGRVYKRRT
jgi:alpha-1,2-mannosyltransferase